MFDKPNIITYEDKSMHMMQDETLGPVSPIQKVESEAEAISLANNTTYGLAAYVFTESVARGTRVIEQLNFGIIGWNDGAPSAAQVPFGCIKDSGICREGGYDGYAAFVD